MIQILLIFLIISALLVVSGQKTGRIIIYLAAYSLISSICFFFLAAPDAAIAEAVVSVFSTILFIIAFEKHMTFSELVGTARNMAIVRRFSIKKGKEIIPSGKQLPVKEKKGILSHILPIVFTALLFALFIMFVPDGTPNTSLKDLYIARFMSDVGGENAVTSIYLGYRMYDTLFEALMLLVSVVAVIHMSWYKNDMIPERDKQHAYFGKSVITSTMLRLIWPAHIIVSIYLIVNGHLSPGGGFQGGVVLASFFICRYMLYGIYGMPIGKVLTLEKLIYTGIILLAIFFIFNGAYAYLSFPRHIYLITMNSLIGLKVACGFLVIFYRFILFERR